MPLFLPDYEALAREAIRLFYTRREGVLGEPLDNRAAVVGGGNLDGFVEMVQAVVQGNGLPAASLWTRGRTALSLPGYFRPTKNWDILVVHNDRLVAALEFKSHVGPSFGNNFNNRCEEALGMATDLWTAYRENAFGHALRPFVGYLMLLEACDASRRPVKTESPHFTVFPEFADASYAQRYEILCRKLMSETLYDAASLLLAARTDSHTGAYTEMSADTGLRPFLAGLAARVASAAAGA